MHLIDMMETFSFKKICRFEIDIPKPVGFDMGYWGSPSCLGQGLNVLEHVPKYGLKCNTWYVFLTPFHIIQANIYIGTILQQYNFVECTRHLLLL